MLIQVSPLLGCSSCDVSKRKACRLLATKAVFPPHQVKQQAQLGSQQPSTTNALFSKVDSMFVSFCSRRNAPNPVHPERALGHKGARRSRKCSISFSKSSSTQDPPQTHGFIRSLQLPKTKLINETLSMRVSLKKKKKVTTRIVNTSAGGSFIRFVMRVGTSAVGTTAATSFAPKLAQEAV